MANPGTEELQRIIKCMKDYEYDETFLEPGDIDGDYKFRLIKRVDYISDDTIKVTIDFSTGFDDDNTYEKDDDGEFYNVENNDKAHQFIKKLINDDLTKKGGQRKKQKKHQQLQLNK